MLLLTLFQSFFLSLFSQPASDQVGLQESQYAIAAEETSYQLVQGYDEYTGLSYSHSLPSLGDSGFGPQRIDSNSLGLLTNAESVLVADRRTSKILYEKSIHDVRPIASITKLMTALILSDKLDPESVVTILPQDKIEGGRIWVYSGEQITVQDLWMVGLIASDNVAISALVRHAGYSKEEFVQLMNERAVELGMKSTEYSEPTGISRWNVSTAADLAILYDKALSHTKISDTLRRPVYTFSPINKEGLRTVKNTNALLNSYINEEPYKLIGGKTGFTHEAGYCLGVIADGPNSNDEIIVIVLGTDTNTDRFQEVKGLIDWTYRNYRWK